MAISTLDEYLETIPNDDNRARMVEVLNWVTECYPELELCIAWNEPFAREGYHFKNEDLQDYFEGTSWYRDRNAQVNLTGAAAANNELLRELADTTGDGSKWKDLAAGN